jgi:hypothetical protein
MVRLVDACLEIDIAFCKNGGASGRISDLPAFTAGSVIYRSGVVGKSPILTLMVTDSLPSTQHSVFDCPGTIYGGVYGSGYPGCTFLGTFLTDSTGVGFFKLSRNLTGKTIAINVPTFSTVLANHPADPIQ